MEAPAGKIAKGKAVKCILCGGTLVLNSTALRQHVGSKKHKKSLKEVEKDGHADVQLHEAFCFAEDHTASGDEEEEVETYGERMARINAALDAAKAEAAKKAAAAKEKQKKKRQAKKGQEPKKRPGKRQRQALKEAAAAAGELRAPKEKKSKKKE